MTILQQSNASSTKNKPTNQNPNHIQQKEINLKKFSHLVNRLGNCSCSPYVWEQAFNHHTNSGNCKRINWNDSVLPGCWEKFWKFRREILMWGFFYLNWIYVLNGLSKSLHLICFWIVVIFCGRMCYSWVCYEHDWWSQYLLPWFLSPSSLLLLYNVRGWHTLNLRLSGPQVAMLSPIFYQWFVCKLFRISMLVKDKKAPEVCFFFNDVWLWTFDPADELVDKSLYAKFVLGLPLKSKSNHKPVKETNNCLKYSE